MNPQVRTRQTLPSTDLAVSALCLGGNRFGADLNDAESFELLDAYVELGGNFIDSALVYADWIEGIERSCSERTIGRWLASRGNRADVVIATKGGHPELTRPDVPRLDAASLRADVLASIDHLGGDPIDLYYLHRDDPARPVADILETLETLVADGLIRYYAASNFSAGRLADAAGWAAQQGVAGFVAHQLEWSLARPRPESLNHDLTWMNEELSAFHLRTGMTAIPYSSQARGFFDKITSGLPLPENVRRYDTVLNDPAVQTVRELATKFDVAGSTVALAGLLQAGLTTVPVIGCGTTEQLRRSWSALDLPLEPADCDRLAALALTGGSR